MAKFTRNAIICKVVAVYNGEEKAFLITESERAKSAFKKAHKLADEVREKNVGVHIDVDVGELVMLLNAHKPEAIEVMTPTELFKAYPKKANEEEEATEH